MVSGFHHAALAVSNLERAVEFYADVLDWEPLGPDDPEKSIDTADYYWMRISAGEWANLAERPDATPEPTGQTDDPHLAFSATEEETAALADRLRERGVDVREEATGIYFHDPDGNYFEVTHWQGPDGRWD
jgi:catechol 2,3-dioxygenase-like lactoylglutathione lyase family enzyme